MATAEHPVTRSELRAELAHYATKADLAEMKAELIKWMVGVMLGGMATAATLTVALLKLLGD